MVQIYLEHLTTLTISQHLTVAMLHLTILGILNGLTGNQDGLTLI
jgi:hypothetical protein